MSHKTEYRVHYVTGDQYPFSPSSTRRPINDEDLAEILTLAAIVDAKDSFGLLWTRVNTSFKKGRPCSALGKDIYSNHVVCTVRRGKIKCSSNCKLCVVQCAVYSVQCTQLFDYPWSRVTIYINLHLHDWTLWAQESGHLEGRRGGG